MKIKEKLAEFSKTTMRAAADKNACLKTQIDAEFAAASRVAEQESKREARRLYDEARRKAELARNHTVLEATVASRRSLVTLREALTEKLFDQAEKALADYTQTAEYADELVASVNALAEEQVGRLVVTLCPRDMALAARFDNAFVTVQEGEADMRGGFRARVAGRPIQYDHSYAERLNEARASFNGFKITD